MLKLIYGEDVSAVHRQLSTLLSSYGETAILKMNESELDYALLENHLRSVSMFDTHLAIVVVGKLDIKKCNLEIVNNPEIKNDLLIVVEGDLSASNSLKKEVERVGGTIFAYEIEPEKEIFGFLEAVAQRQRVKAAGMLKLLWDQDKDPIYIQSMLVWQYRSILAPELQKGYTRQKAEKLRLQYSEDELFKIYRMLYQLELRLKTGEGDPHALIEEFVLKITQN